VRLAQGDESQALALAERALAALPSAEVLLQARVAAVAAEAARALGRDAAAYGYYERAMQKDAGTLRRLGLALPAHVRATGAGALSRGWARCSGARRGCARTTGASRCWSPGPTRPCGCACARRSARSSPARSRARPRRETEAFAARAVLAFHAQAFATRVGLSTTDVRSLDGTTTANDAAAREQMNGVLRDIAAPGGDPVSRPRRRRRPRGRSSVSGARWCCCPRSRPPRSRSSAPGFPPPAICADPLEGVWVSHKYESPYDEWMIFTLDVRRDPRGAASPNLRGRAGAHPGGGAHHGARVVRRGAAGLRAAAVPAGHPPLEVGMSAEGFADGGRIEFWGTRWSVQNVWCGPRSFGYNLDHFTGVIDPSSRSFNR
jgi:hypothetical protein